MPVEGADRRFNGGLGHAISLRRRFRRIARWRFTYGLNNNEWNIARRTRRVSGFSSPFTAPLARFQTFRYSLSFTLASDLCASNYRDQRGHGYQQQASQPDVSLIACPCSTLYLQRP